MPPCVASCVTALVLGLAAACLFGCAQALAPAVSPTASAAPARQPAGPIQHVIVVTVDGLTPESYLAPDAHGLHTVDIAPTVADWLHLEIRAPSIPAPTGIEPIAAGAGLRDKLPPKTIPHFTFGPACTS